MTPTLRTADKARIRRSIRPAHPRRILSQGSPLMEAEVHRPGGLKAAVTKLGNGPSAEDPWSKLVEVITLDQADRSSRSALRASMYKRA